MGGGRGKWTGERGDGDRGTGGRVREMGEGDGRRGDGSARIRVRNHYNRRQKETIVPVWPNLSRQRPPSDSKGGEGGGYKEKDL